MKRYQWNTFNWGSRKITREFWTSDKPLYVFWSTTNMFYLTLQSGYVIQNTKIAQLFPRLGTQ